MKQPRKLNTPARKNPRFNSISEFILGRKLGDGAYAVVRKAIHIQSEETFAIKIIALESLGENDYENVEKELDIHSSISHPAIIKLVDFFQDAEKVYLVLEFAEKGNLFKFMHQSLTPDPELMGRMWAQTVSAIEYLHGRDVIMRDLKPENILVTRSLDIKICDFGWAARIDDVEYRRLKAGTYIYMSPESLLGKLQGFQTDVWSLGVLLFEMHHNREPFSCGISCQEQLFFIREQQVYFKSGIDSRVKLLVGGCLVEDKAKRFNLSDLVQSAYVKEYLGKKVDVDAAKSRSSLGFLTSHNMIGKKKPVRKEEFSGAKGVKHPKKVLSRNVSFNQFKVEQGRRSSPSKQLTTQIKRKKTIKLNDFITKKLSQTSRTHVTSSSNFLETNNRLKDRKSPKPLQMSQPTLYGLSTSSVQKINMGVTSHSVLPRSPNFTNPPKVETLEKKVVTNKKLLGSNIENKIENINNVTPSLGKELKETGDVEDRSPMKVFDKAKKENITEDKKSQIQNKISEIEKSKTSTFNTHVQTSTNASLKIKRSNTFVGRPMFAPGFTQRKRNIDLFKHRKNYSLNENLFQKIGKFPPKEAETDNLHPKKLQESILQNSKMETKDPVKPQKNVGVLLKRSTSKRHINLNSYISQKASTLQSTSKLEKSITAPPAQLAVSSHRGKLENRKMQKLANSNLKMRQKSKTFAGGNLLKREKEEDASENPLTLRTRDSSTNLSKHLPDQVEEELPFQIKKPRNKTEPFEHVLAKKTSVRKIKLNEYFNKK